MWDRHEVDLVGFSSGRPWIAVTFDSFSRVFILLQSSLFFPFWL